MVGTIEIFSGGRSENVLSIIVRLPVTILINKGFKNYEKIYMRPLLSVSWRPQPHFISRLMWRIEGMVSKFSIANYSAVFKIVVTVTLFPL